MRYLVKIEAYVFTNTEEEAVEAAHKLANNIDSDFDNDAKAVELYAHEWARGVSHINLLKDVEL